MRPLLHRVWISLLAGVFCFAMHAQPPKIQWVKSTPIPETTGGYAAGVFDGKLVIAGGTYWEGSKGDWIKKVFTASVLEFDPATEKWRKLPDMPVPLAYAASVMVGDKLFVLGGFTGEEINSNIYTLSKGRDGYLWKRFGTMPANRLFAGITSVGHSIYLLGGTERFEPYDQAGTCCTSKTAVTTLLTLDTAAPDPKWRALTPFPGATRWLFALDGDGENLWMFGGAYQEKVSDPVTRFPEVWRYRIDQDQWLRTGPIPAAALEASPLVPVAVGKFIFLVSYKKTIWSFDTASREWSETSPLPEEAFVDKYFLIDGKIVGATGENRLGTNRRRSEWTFIGKVVPNGQ
jgi:N-acetylneuraminic acid mutarotase